MSSLTFSFATLSDATVVQRLLLNCGLPNEDVHQHLDHFIVAKDGDQLAGVIGLQLLGRTGLLRSLAVDSRYRNQGLGKALYAKLVGYAHLRGIAKLYLLTLTTQEYFSKLGFEKVDRADVPPEIGTTAEFRDLCPSTAVCLAKDIQNEARYFPKEVLRLRPDVPGARMWGVALQKTMLTYFEVDPQSRFERHSHESEQITMVLKGELYFEIDERVVRVNEGEVIAIPSNLPHAVFTKELSVEAVDAWSPLMGKYDEDLG
jgi:amino-acid N-acetyltransferase